MPLESSIQNLSDAIHRLAEGVEKLLSISQPSTAAAPTPRKTNVDGAKIEKAAAEVLDTAAKQEIAAQAEPLVQTAVAEQLPAEVEHSIEVAQATAPPTFDDAKRAFLAIAQKYGAVEGTTKSKDVLARYGVPNLKALKPELYGEFIELCDHVVAGGGV